MSTIDLNVLVAGGAGYIGSHCCKALPRAGSLPVTCDNLVYGYDWAVKWGPLERGAILDRARLDQVLAAHRPAAILRLAAFAYVGELVTDPDGEIGEEHDPKTHVIPLALDTASGRRPNVTVFGAVHETPDGTCVRDYIHVADLADAHVEALRALEAGAATDACNLRVGRGYSVREVIDAVGRVTNMHPPVVMGACQPGGPAILLSDATKAGDRLGWRPKITDLEAIVRSASLWRQRAALTDASAMVVLRNKRMAADR